MSFGVESTKNTAISTQTSIADSFNTDTSTVSNKENLGNTTVSFGLPGSGAAAYIPAIATAGFVIAALMILNRRKG